jgi:hypothetical protein
MPAKCWRRIRPCHRARRAGVSSRRWPSPCLLSLAGTASLYFRPPPPRVDVNFISEPFEAAIYLDGAQLTAPDGTPYTTPCTARDLPGGQHHLLFKHPERGDYDAGHIDLTHTREVIVRWDNSR